MMSNNDGGAGGGRGGRAPSQLCQGFSVGCLALKSGALYKHETRVFTWPQSLLLHEPTRNGQPLLTADRPRCRHGRQKDGDLAEPPAGPARQCRCVSRADAPRLNHARRGHGPCRVRCPRFSQGPHQETRL